MYHKRELMEKWKILNAIFIATNQLPQIFSTSYDISHGCLVMYFR